MTGKTLSHYEILDKLGEGGMGAVYKARDARLDRFVALKLLPPFANEEEQERFVREAKTISGLNHPHIAILYDIGEDQEQQFLVLEYLPGGTLKQQITSLTRERALELATQVAHGLAYAHRNGVIHRDIKPENILLTNEGSAKIVDFGLARLQGRSRLTRVGTTVGTLAYMSPEQLQGMETESRTDIWAFGVMVFEMLAGELPFRGEHEAAIMYSVVNEQPDLGKLPRMYQPLIKRALAKEANERYSSMDHVLEELLRIREASRETESEEKGKSDAEPGRRLSAIMFNRKLFLTVFLQRLVHTRQVVYGLSVAAVIAVQIFVLPGLLQENKNVQLAGFPNALTSNEEEPREEDYISKENVDENDVYRTMIVMLRGMNKSDEVIAVARKYVKMKPGSVAAWLTLGFALELDKQYNEAATTYEKAAQLEPDNVDARMGLGRTCLLTRKFDESKKNLEFVLAVDPSRKDLPKLLWKLGDGFAQVQRYPEALPLYQKATQLMARQGKGK